MEKKLNCDILTPDSEIFSGQIKGVRLPGTEGGFEILHNHAPMIATLGKGKIILNSGEGEKSLDAEGGVVEVINNKVIILLENAGELN